MTVCTNEEWLFTFGYGHAFPNRFVRLNGTMTEARKKMIDTYGVKWAFQYPATDEHRLKRHGITEISHTEVIAERAILASLGERR